MNISKSICLLVLLLITTSFAQDISPLPVTVSHTDPKIRYVGRFTKDENGPRCSWSASMIEIKFNGTDLQAKFRESGKDFWQVIVDGKPASVISLNTTETLYQVASGLSKSEHTIQLVKRTEAFVGISQFMGFQINEGAKLLETTVPARKIEVIGDSISCGYGNEDTVKENHFAPATENAYLTYGAIAARLLNADYQCVAWSGRKLWPDNTTPSVYDAILPIDLTAPKWDYSKSIPDVIVINLATNDFAKSSPDGDAWMQAYVDFIKRLRSYYPKAHIYCMVGPLITDAWPPERKVLSLVRGYIQKVVTMVADDKVHYFEVPPQEFANGIGADWHPSIKTNQLMGEQLAATIKRDLAW